MDEQKITDGAPAFDLPPERAGRRGQRGPKSKPDHERSITVTLPESYSEACEAIGAAGVGVTATEARAIIRKAAVEHLATMKSVNALVAAELEARKAKLGQLGL